MTPGTSPRGARCVPLSNRWFEPSGTIPRPFIFCSTRAVDDGCWRGISCPMHAMRHASGCCSARRSTESSEARRHGYHPRRTPFRRQALQPVDLLPALPWAGDHCGELSEASQRTVNATASITDLVLMPRPHVPGGDCPRTSATVDPACRDEHRCHRQSMMPSGGAEFEQARLRPCVRNRRDGHPLGGGRMVPRWGRAWTGAHQQAALRLRLSS